MITGCGPVLPRCRYHDLRPLPSARLGRGPSGAQAQVHIQAAAVAGVHRARSQPVLQLRPVLRALSMLPKAAETPHAPEPQSGREVFGRLLWPDAVHHQPAEGGSQWHRSSSPSSAPATTPVPKRPGPRDCETGWAAIGAPSSTSAVYRR